MKILLLKRFSAHAPPILVLVFCILMTLLGFIVERDFAHERISLRAAADAEQFQRTLQQGMNSHTQLNRSLVGYFANSAVPTVQAFSNYIRTSRILDEHSAISHIGYLPKILRTDRLQLEKAPEGQNQLHGLRDANSDYVYPYLFTYPLNGSAVRFYKTDYSAVPQRWAAMQQARDSGKSTATVKHLDVMDREQTFVIVIFTPVYDMSLPTSTVAQRGIALRGFVFSICPIAKMIEHVMGSDFYRLFDLEIYDGSARAENILYDGDKRPHAVMADKDFSIARHAKVAVAGRQWELFFFPKPDYLTRYQNWRAELILLFGSLLSVALTYAVWIWYRRVRIVSLQGDENVRFDAVFENHPSAVYLLDLNCRLINANAQTVRELKTSKADLIGKSVSDFLVAEDHIRTKAHFENVLGGNSNTYDSAVIDGKGRRIEINVVLIPIKVHNQVVSVLGIAQNVTERKMNEWRLMESKKMLRLVINHIPQRVFWKDTQLVYLGCNDAFCQDAGLSHPDEIVGKTDFDLSWHANAEIYRKGDLETLNGSTKLNFEEGQNRDDGTFSWLRTTKMLISNVEGETVGVLGMYEDITERKSMEQQLKEMAHYDSLTGLANRAFFYHDLERAASNARRHGGLFASVYLDLDRFKLVNDTYGHDVGDSVLREFACRIKDVVRETDLIARLGGDEFALLLEDFSDRATVETLVRKLIDIMQIPFSVGDINLTIHTSVGIAFSTGTENTGNVLRRADQAMYKAKRGGRNRYEIDHGVFQHIS